MTAEGDDHEFTCPFCGQLFVGQGLLAEHFEDKHDFSGLAVEDVSG